MEGGIGTIVAGIFGTWHFLQMLVVAGCGIAYWRVPRGWRALRGFSFATSQKWLAGIGWTTYVVALALWGFLLVMSAFTWFGSIGRTGPDTSLMATLMVTLLVLPASLFLLSMTSFAFGAIEEVEGNRRRGANAPSAD